MSKEQIIEIMQKHWHQDGYYTASFDSDSCANELFAKFEQDKIDLLKEFVEWLKIKYQKERESWFEIAKEKEQAKDEWEKSKANCYFGRSYGFDRAATDLDKNLEKFLEEKNENNIKNN